MKLTKINFKFYITKLSVLFFLILTLISNNQAFTGEDDGVSIYFYNGIPGCGCYYHCGCFSHYIYAPVPGGFPENTVWHPLDLEEKIWHEFMIKFLLARQAGPQIWKSECGQFSLPTTKGTIHYSKRGAHIVPANPNKKLW